jgi:ABC-type branched-subunit amino acid transport system substrate-binding protein
MEGRFIGRLVAERLGAQRALILYVGDEYGSGLRAGTEAALAERGVQVVDRVALELSGRCPRGSAANPSEDLITLALRKGVPDVVVLASRAAEAGCALQAIHRRLPRMRYVAGDGVIPEALALDAPAEAVDSTYFITFWHADTTDARTREFVAAFRRSTGRDPHYGDALVYDATQLLIDAIRSVGTDRERVRDYLRELGGRRPAPAGLTGPLTFEPAARRGIVVVRRQGGATVLVRGP